MRLVLAPVRRTEFFALAVGLGLLVFVFGYLLGAQSLPSLQPCEAPDSGSAPAKAAPMKNVPMKNAPIREDLQPGGVSQAA